MSSKAKNDENIAWSSRGECGSLAACCAKSSSSDSTAGEHAHQNARTELDASLQQEWGSWIDPVARSGEGVGNSGRAAKGHEERFIPRKQHSVLRFRCARNAATNVRCHGRLIEKTKATRRSRAWSEFSGTSHDATRVSRALQEESAGVHGVDQHRRKTTRRVQRGGRRARRIHERHVFFAGLQAHVGERLTTARRSEAPEFCKTKCVTTPMAWRCLRGWRRLFPSRSRAFPLPVWAAMAGVLAYGSCFSFAETHLTPSELVQLHNMDLIEAKKGVLQLRHSRPSIDISNKSRTLDAIMKKKEMAKRQNGDDIRKARD